MNVFLIYNHFKNPYVNKKLRLSLTFYQNFYIVSLLITAGCLFIYGRYGLATFSGLFWFKIITLGLIYFVISTSKSKEFYYYQNLGVSRAFLWSTTFAFDFIIFILFIILIHQIR